MSQEFSYADSESLEAFINGRDWEKACDLLASSDEFATDFLLNGLRTVSRTVSCEVSCPPRFVRMMLAKLQNHPWWHGYRSLLDSQLDLGCKQQGRQFLTNSFAYGSADAFKEFAKVLVKGVDKSDINWARREVARLWLKVATNQDSPTKLHPQVEKEVLQLHSVQDLEQFPWLRQSWTKTELLLQAMLLKDLDDPSTIAPWLKDFGCPSADAPWLVTHALAELDFPSLLLWLALRMQPEQAWTRDHLGRLPLHYAAQHDPTNCIPLDCTGELSPANEYPFTLLLRAFPEAATLADSSGKRPLNYALDLFGDKGLNRWSKDCIVEHLVDPLIAAAPETLAKRERGTRLYPYQQAAVKDAPLDVVYKLLVGNPSIIHSRDRSWVEKENASLLAENDALKGKISEQSTGVVRLAEEVARLEKELAKQYSVKAPTPTKRKKEEDPDDVPGSKRSGE